MYAIGTILALKDPRSTTDKVFPYDEVEVLGESPVHHGVYAEQWSGTNGQGVVLRPLTDFGTTLDEPFGKLTRLYDVQSVPDAVERQVTVKVIQQADLGPSPEEQFAAAAVEAGLPDGRDAAPEPDTSSPLGDDPEPEETASPLPDPEPEEPVVPKAPDSPLD